VRAHAAGKPAKIDLGLEWTFWATGNMCVSARYHWRKLIGKPAQELQLPGISGIKDVKNSKKKFQQTFFVRMTDLG
jgi:hypothetical protein